MTCHMFIPKLWLRHPSWLALFSASCDLYLNQGEVANWLLCYFVSYGVPELLSFSIDYLPLSLNLMEILKKQFTQ